MNIGHTTTTTTSSTSNTSTNDHSSNYFLSTIRATFPSVYSALLSNDWILLIPITLDYHTSILLDKNPLVISEDFVATHILRATPTTTDFVTLNNKTVLIKDDTITPDKGFPYSDSSHSKKWHILYDDVFVDETTGKSFMVYVIDAPLEGGGGNTSNSDSQNDDQTRHVAESVVSLTRILQQLPTTNNTNNILTKLDDLITSFNDKTISTIETLDLQQLQTNLRNLLSSVTQYLFKSIDNNTLTKLVTQTFQLNMDIFYQIIESHVMEKTYELVFFRITTFHRDQDSLLSSLTTKELKDLDLSQMGLDNNRFGKCLRKAVMEFGDLSRLRTPFEKIKCLVRTLRCFENGSSGLRVSDFDKEKENSHPLTTDHLIPLLLLTVIRSNIMTLQSNLYYMRHFSFETDVAAGEDGFAVSTLEAVGMYLDQAKTELRDLSGEVSEVWRLVRDGDVEAVKGFKEGSRKREKRRKSKVLVVDTQLKTQSPAIFSPLSARSPVLISMDDEEVINSDENAPISPILPTDQPRQHELELDIIRHARDHNGNNTVLYSINTNQHAMTQYLLTEYPIPISECINYSDENILHTAVIHDRVEIIEFVLGNFEHERMKLLTARDAVGNTPLLSAVCNSRLEALKVLCGYNPDLDVRNDAGMGVLHLFPDVSVLECFYEIIGRDKMRMMDWNSVDNSGLTALLFHCQRGNVELVSKFCELAIELDMSQETKMELNASDPGKRTCLHLCSFRGYLDLIKELVSVAENYGERFGGDLMTYLDLNGVSLRGNTALHAAADASQLNVVRYLLDLGVDVGVLNGMNKTPAELAKDSVVRDCLDDYALMRIGVYGQRVASVVRGIVESDREYLFVVKSGTIPDLGSITTVQRSVGDFVVLRSQLLVETPEAALPDLKDLGNSAMDKSTMNTNTSSRHLKRVIKRLNTFIRYLLSHPVYTTHELVWEFLVMPDLDMELISTRTRSKREFVVEMIAETYSPLVEDVESLKNVYKSCQEDLNGLQSGYRDLVGKVRCLGKAKKGVSNSLRVLQYYLGRPMFLRNGDGGSGENGFDDMKLVVTDVLRKCTDSLLRESGLENSEWIEVLGVDVPAVITGGNECLGSWVGVVGEYGIAVKGVEKTRSLIRRLESQAGGSGKSGNEGESSSSSNSSLNAVTSAFSSVSTNLFGLRDTPSTPTTTAQQTEDLVRKISEAYYQQQLSIEELHTRGCFVNYVDGCVRGEYEACRKFLAMRVEEVVEGYVEGVLRSERECLKVLEGVVGSSGSSNISGRKESAELILFGEGVDDGIDVDVEVASRGVSEGRSKTVSLLDMDDDTQSSSMDVVSPVSPPPPDVPDKG